MTGDRLFALLSFLFVLANVAIFARLYHEKLCRKRGINPIPENASDLARLDCVFHLGDA